MITIISNKDSVVAHLVLAAMKRSVGFDRVELVAPELIEKLEFRIVVLISPDENVIARLFERLAEQSFKLIIFGRLPESLKSAFQVKVQKWPEQWPLVAQSDSAASGQFAESLASVTYTQLIEQFSLPQWRRPFERFDFTDEWNNLGYGAIRADDSIWAVCSPFRVESHFELGVINIEGNAAATYSAVVESENATILWFNREVGPIDSFEWRIVEKFLSSYRYEDFPCHPVILEIPWGYDALITMRLDCDEDIESARALRSAYHELKIPFSLAIHTKNLTDERNHSILIEMIQNNEALLSHTATHAPDWGGDYDNAMVEAALSSQRIEDVTGFRVRYAVSPFHQSPPFALSALADSGYAGCIGGIIRNDPEFLFARGGTVAGLPESFIGHSQQCMLHGDCLLNEGDPLSIYKQAFMLAYETQSLFGYLDHPFSERYQYGWSDEVSRIDAHQKLIDHIRASTSSPLFLSENDAMDFIANKQKWRVSYTDNIFHSEYKLESSETSALVPTIEYCGKQYAATQGILG